MGQPNKSKRRYTNYEPKAKIQNDNPDEVIKETVEKDSTYKVKVSIKNLNIRKGPGMNYAKTGKFTGPGIFKIVEICPGEGSKEGWGRLEHGGWISLHFCEVFK